MQFGQKKKSTERKGEDCKSYNHMGKGKRNNKNKSINFLGSLLSEWVLSGPVK